MPSLIITGHPCVGKTTFSHLLISRALAHSSISNVVHITESSSCQLSKRECYTSSNTEKETRAALKSKFDHAITNGNTSTLVILDSLNYIKGYRYELYCISKAAGEQHGVIWVMGSKADGERRVGSSDSDILAKQRNQDRAKLNNNTKQDEIDDYFEEHIMDELVARFEPPDDRNRWENPLYKVDVSSLQPWDVNGTIKTGTELINEDVSQQMEEVHIINDDQPKKPAKSASGFKRNKKAKVRTAQTSGSITSTTQSFISSASSEIQGPMSMAARRLPNPVKNDTINTPDYTTIEETIDSILSSFLSTQPLKEGMSTANNTSAESDVLNAVDSVTQRVNSEIIKTQKLTSSDTSSGRLKIIISLSKQWTLTISKHLNSTELRNIRTQFLKWTASHPSGSKEDEIVKNYLAFIESVVCGKD